MDIRQHVRREIDTVAAGNGDAGAACSVGRHWRDRFENLSGCGWEPENKDM
jgi:cysteine synthase